MHRFFFRNKIERLRNNNLLTKYFFDCEINVYVCKQLNIVEPFNKKLLLGFEHLPKNV